VLYCRNHAQIQSRRPVVRKNYVPPRFTPPSNDDSPDEYNKAVRDCDIFVSLFFTKAGKFTEEEFDVALGAFKKKGKPRIFTFFKGALVNIDSLPEEDLSSLRALQRKLSDLGHFNTRYDNVADLKLKFRDQLDKVTEQTRTS